MTRFAVIGLGTFGMALAEELARLEERVTALDADDEKVSHAQSFVDTAVVADAKDFTTLKALGIGEMDVAAVSLGGDAGATTLVALHLTRLGVPLIIAKALNEDHGEILSRVGVHRVVFPEKEMAMRVAGRLASANVMDYLSVGKGLSMLELAPPSSFVGKALSDLNLARAYGVQVLAVKELVPERVNLIPGPEYVVKDSDILLVSGSEENLAKVGER